jgi:hypothetical protein
MSNDLRVLTSDELNFVSGGCTHGSGDCHNGKGDGLGQLRQFEGAVLGGLINAGKAIAGLFGL